MPEIILHYIWRERLFAGFRQYTTDGRLIEVVSVGQHNTGAGPDFTNAHVRIYGRSAGETDGAQPDINGHACEDWYGNIEIHVLSSDWYKHGHHTDPSYDNVILHIVSKADKQVFNSQGEAIVQCALQYPSGQDYVQSLLSSAKQMDSGISGIRCGEQLLRLPGLLTDGWKSTLLLDQLACKQASVKRLLEITHHNWEEAFYISLAHYFGFHTNGIPFESLALSLPLSYLNKHRDRLDQLTALLLGQSGLLREETAQTVEDRQLLSEYRFLATKFGVKPIDYKLWKSGRLRPQNSPQTRIRQFARLLYQSEFLFSRLMTADDLSTLREVFALPKPAIGKASVDVLIMNAVLPFRYAYLMAYGDIAKARQTLAFFDELPAEDNEIIRRWKVLGQKVVTAADSQALLHLYKHFCQDKRCINCEVAYQVFIVPKEASDRAGAEVEGL